MLIKFGSCGHLKELLQHTKVRILGAETQQVITELSDIEASFDFGYLQCPVFCMFLLDQGNLYNIIKTGKDRISI